MSLAEHQFASNPILLSAPTALTTILGLMKVEWALPALLLSMLCLAPYPT